MSGRRAAARSSVYDPAGSARDSAMFQSSARAPRRASTLPPASCSTARTGVVPALVRLTTRGAAIANVTLAGSDTNRGVPGCNCSLDKARWYSARSLRPRLAISRR